MPSRPSRPSPLGTTSGACSAHSPHRRATPRRARATRTVGTKRLLAARRADSARRVFFCASTGVLGTPMEEAMKNTPTMRRVALIALSLAGLAGCAGGHGKETSRELVRANATLAGIKAGNEYQQAEQAYLAGDLDKALKLVDRSLQINPSVTKSHVLRGRIHLERSDLEGSLNEFQKAEALDPKNVEAQYYQGIVYERFQQSDKALEHYEQASKLE